MAASKHKLGAEAETAAARPHKKSRVESGAEKDGRDGKGKKDKKRPVDADADADAEAEAVRRAEKEAKKARKQAKRENRRKLKEAGEQQPAGREQPRQEAEETEATGAKDKARKKSGKAKGKKADASQQQQRDGDAGGYVQTMSLSTVAQADIDAFLAEHHITVTDPRGAAALRPVTGFEHLPATNLLEKRPSPFAGFKAPTPIQAASWPFTLSGRDVVGVAETGSGKTMAFALPCVEAVSSAAASQDSSSSSSSSDTKTRAVVVSPTRELAMQTHEQMARLAALVGLRCVCLYGGASKDEQRAQLRRGCDVVVATPGRLKDFMADGTVDLGGARFVVLDEADRMLDKGFEDDIKHILGCCPARHDRQTLMFTATWPQSVQALASTFMVDPVKVTIGAGRDDDNGGGGGGGGVELQANARIAQSVEVVDPRDKEGRLLQILKQRQQGAHRMDRILVFCLYKKEATRIEALLSRKGVRVVGIHGDLRQEQRTRSLEAFKSGTTPVLVATDVAARGLDIPEVKLVINVTVRLARVRLSFQPPYPASMLTPRSSP